MQNSNSVENLTQIIDSKWPNITKEAIVYAIKQIKNEREIEMDEIADLISFLADTNHRNWPLKEILEAISVVIEGINWRKIYEILLDGNKKIANLNYLKMTIDCWIIISGNVTVPYEIFFQKANELEKNAPNATITFYKGIIDNSIGNIDLYSNIFFTNLIGAEQFKTKYKRTIDIHSNLNCKELFMAIKNNKELIFYIKEKSPEFCMLGAISILGNSVFNENPGDDFIYDVFYSLFNQFSEGSTNHFIVQILFEIYKEKILFLYQKSDISITKTLDILLEHKQLSFVTDNLEPYDFCYDLIVLCGRRDHLNLEFWVNNNIDDYTKFINYFYRRIVGISNEKLFPFNSATILLVLRILDSKEGIINIPEEAKNKLLIIKSKNSDACLPNDKATKFLSEIIQSNLKVEEALEKLNDFLKNEDQTLAKKIFNLLIENYTGLYKLANSDMIAGFFGELIRKEIGMKPFIKLALNLIKTSLSVPKNDREYNFAFRIFECLYNDNPDEFMVLEAIENVRIGLVKKELIIVDEEPPSAIEFCQFISHITGVNLSEVNNDKISDQIIREFSTLNKIMYTSKASSPLESISVCSVYSVKTIMAVILYKLTTNVPIYVGFALNQSDHFIDQICDFGFRALNQFLHFSFKGEKEFSSSLGQFLGKLILAENKPLITDAFDVNNFILKSVEYKRIGVCVNFVSNFIKEGVHGMIYVPKNPWLMDILDLLSELHSCTLFNIRQSIKDIFIIFKLPLNNKRAVRVKGALSSYDFFALHKFYANKNRKNLISDASNYGTPKIVSKVVSLALDFSTREVASKVTNSSILCSQNLVFHAYMSIKDIPTVKDKKFQMFRNLLSNTVRMNTFIASYDLLKNSLYGNISHFLKLSLNSLPEEVIIEIINSNLNACIDVIEKATITTMKESVGDFFNKITDFSDDSLAAENSLNPPDFTETLHFLSESHFSEKKSLRSIENNEYQEIRSFLIQLGRKIPIKKRNFIFDEFPSILGDKKFLNFKKMMLYLKEKSTTKDEDCMSLTKYLVGHALKRNCKDEFTFEFLYQIFAISNKTKKETVGWLIYSEDESKNINLIKKFIEYDFIFIEEYDQALARFISKDKEISSGYLNFAVTLLEDLILGNKSLCSVYNFIYTIESISKKSDISVTAFEFLKKIEGHMLDFGVNCEKNIFDDFVLSLKFSTTNEELFNRFKSEYKIDQFNFDAALKSCWNHFVLYHGNYRFFKIDILPYLIKNNVFKYVYRCMEFLLQAYKKRMYLFNKFFCRFFIQLLDTFMIDEDQKKLLSNKAVIMRILEILSPTAFPCFTAQFLEIVQHRFFDSISDGELFWISREFLEVLKYNEKYEKLFYDFFVKKELFIKRFNSYLCFLCPNYCITLKNLFTAREKCPTNASKNGYFYKIYYKGLQKISGPSQQMALDFCLFHSEGFHEKLSTNPEETVLSVLTRYYSKNPPQNVQKVYEELCKTNPNIVREYENQYFKITNE
ncbi:general negative regulator of transcription subfamily 1 [Nucleospora cyclopteri]